MRLSSDLVQSPDMLEGRWLVEGDDNAIVITTAMQNNEPDLTVGQEIVLKFNDRKHSFTIVGLARGMGSNTAYSSFNYISDILRN